MNRYPIRSKILIVTEGYTEKNYLEKLRERGTPYEVIVRKSPDNPARKILRFCIAQIRELGLDLKKGDSAYCVLDVDYTDPEVLKSIISEASSRGIHVIISKPCFEVFLLLHFTSDVNRLAIPKDAKEEIGMYLPDYNETRDFSKTLLPLRAKAVERSRTFSLDVDTDFCRICNGTNLYELFDEIRRRKGQD